MHACTSFVPVDGEAFVKRAESRSELVAFETLVREYIASLPFSLDFQDVTCELAELPSQYGPPEGAALIAGWAGEPLGCVGLRRLEEGICELKRMYVRPAGRGRGLGTALCREALTTARQLGYRAVRLDTVASMHEAGRLYTRLGFVPIPAYTNNPLADARYYGLELEPLTESA